MPDWKTGLPRDVVDEINDHLADVRRTALFQGKSTEEANRLAAAELEDIAAIGEVIRRRKTLASSMPVPATNSWTGVGRDIRHAVRLMQARRGYATVLVLTLGVGIGACTAVFSLFSALLLTPLPLPNAHQLVMVWESQADDHSQHHTVAAPSYADWAAETTSFQAMGIYQSLVMNIAGAGDPEQIAGTRASASVFDVLDVAPALGRTFTADEQQRGQQVALISDAVWKSHFQASPSALGQSLRLNGRVYEVIGVMPPDFAFPSRRTGVWVPLTLNTDEQRRDWHAFRVVGRVKQDVAFDQARAEVEQLGAALRQRHAEHANEGATIERMSDVGLEAPAQMLRALGAAVALVLLIACINVAGLQLALGLARQREFATRLSLGARYAHLVRQALVENFVVAALGCVVGLAIAFAVTRGLDFVLSPGFRSMPFRGEIAISIDKGVLLFAIAASVMSALLFAIAPLRALRRESLQPALRAGDRGATQLAAKTRRILVTAEIALAIIVLTAAGLLVRSLYTVLQQAPGLDARNVLTMQVSLPQEDPLGPPERRTFCADLEREASALPGVLRIGAVDLLPLAGSSSNRIFSVDGGPQPPPNQVFAAEYRTVCPSYFSTLAIPLLRGRDFTSRDTVDAEPVVIVNRAFADRYLINGEAIGQRVKLGALDTSNPWLTVIGVADDVRHFGLETAPIPEMYRPYSQVASPNLAIVARTAGEPLMWARPLRDAIRKVDVGIPVANVRPMAHVVASSVQWRETPMRLLAGFAMVGLLLAGVGIYSVLAYYVAQRRREMGLRVALGASKSVVVRLVLRQSMLPLIAGVILGIAGSLAAGKLLAGMLYEVTPGDPLVLSVIVALIVTVSLVASWLPARRAAAVDPLVALRQE